MVSEKVQKEYSLSFLPRIKYGVNSSRNPGFPVKTGTQFLMLSGSLLSQGRRLDSRFHGNDNFLRIYQSIRYKK